MSKRPRHERWLHPSARQPDGSLWLAGPGVKRPRGPVTTNSAWRPPRAAKHGLARVELDWLRDALHHLARRPEWLIAGVPNEARGGAARRPRRARGLASMMERGLLELWDIPPPPRLHFTPAGVAALKALFEAQPADFVTLYPQLHSELGLEWLLPARSSEEQE